MKKILIGYMIDGKSGGIDKYILNVLEQIKDEDVKIDCLTNHIDEDLEKILSNMGVSLIEIPNLKHPMSQYKRMKKVIEENQYDVAYFNISEAFNSIGAFAANRMKVRKVVVHSHSAGIDTSSSMKRRIRRICHEIAKRVILSSSVTDFYACSHKAGEWMFTAKTIDDGKLNVINNAINVNKFSFNKETREKVRSELQIDDRIVVGQVGQMCYAKNTFYLLDIAEQLQKINPQYLLLLIGAGPDYEQIKNEVEKRRLKKSVMLLGIRNDVNEIVQGMDLFVLPSRFEGLPIVAIEAQISGLKTILSENITKESKLSDRCLFLPISSPADVWAKTINENIEYNREDLDLTNAEYCFDINQQNEQIKDIFEI